MMGSEPNSTRDFGTVFTDVMRATGSQVWEFLLLLPYFLYFSYTFFFGREKRDPADNADIAMSPIAQRAVDWVYWLTHAKKDSFGQRGWIQWFIWCFLKINTVIFSMACGLTTSGLLFGFLSPASIPLATIALLWMFYSSTTANFYLSFQKVPQSAIDVFTDLLQNKLWTYQPKDVERLFDKYKELKKLYDLEAARGPIRIDLQEHLEHLKRKIHKRILQVYVKTSKPAGEPAAEPAAEQPEYPELAELNETILTANDPIHKALLEEAKAAWLANTVQGVISAELATFKKCMMGLSFITGFCAGLVTGFLTYGVTLSVLGQLGATQIFGFIAMGSAAFTPIGWVLLGSTTIAIMFLFMRRWIYMFRDLDIEDWQKFKTNFHSWDNFRNAISIKSLLTAALMLFALYGLGYGVYVGFYKMWQVFSPVFGEQVSMIAALGTAAFAVMMRAIFVLTTTLDTIERDFGDASGQYSRFTAYIKSLSWDGWCALLFVSPFLVVSSVFAGLRAGIEVLANQFMGNGVGNGCISAEGVEIRNNFENTLFVVTWAIFAGMAGTWNSWAAMHDGILVADAKNPYPRGFELFRAYCYGLYLAAKLRVNNWAYSRSGLQYASVGGPESVDMDQFGPAPDADPDADQSDSSSDTEAAAPYRSTSIQPKDWRRVAATQLASNADVSLNPQPDQAASPMPISPLISATLMTAANKSTADGMPPLDMQAPFTPPRALVAEQKGSPSFFAGLPTFSPEHPILRGLETRSVDESGFPKPEEQAAHSPHSPSTALGILQLNRQTTPTRTLFTPRAGRRELRSNLAVVPDVEVVDPLQDSQDSDDASSTQPLFNYAYQS